MTDRSGVALPEAKQPFSPEAMQELTSELGVAAYSWSLPDDRLIWSGNARDILGELRWELAHTGAGYGGLVEAGSGASRVEALQQLRLEGEGLSAAGSVPVSGASHMPRPFETVYCLTQPSGHGPHRLWIEDRGVGRFDASGQLMRVDGVIRRFSLGRPVRADQLSRVPPDRLRLAGMVEERLAAIHAEGAGFSFVLVAIDQLGRLNEAYGHYVADELIDIVLLRLTARLREGEEIARFSSNKFALMLREGTPEGLDAAMRRLLSAVNDTPARTASGAVAVTVSAGGLLAPRHGRNAGEIFARAHDALSGARSSAHGSFRSYSPSFDREAERHANLRFADDIVSALGGQRVRLAFQPIADSTTRRIAFHECLVRIEGGNGQVFDGATIIPTAERFGLTRLIDLRALELAFVALEENPHLRLSVNASPGSIGDAAWLDLMEERGRQGLGQRLILELTESTSITDTETLRRTIHRLRDYGCKVAMDDFGVGYTSFRNLRRLGFDMLKIDGSFICSLMESSEDQHFVRVMLDLARNLDIETVAEWVLDEASAGHLAEWGCTYLQGELIGLAAPHPVEPT